MQTEGLVVQEVEGGCRLRVHVKPGARSEGLLGLRAGALRVGVRAAPERGRANEALVRLLADLLDLPRGAVQIVAGRASRAKTLRLAGVSAADLEARLRAL